MSKRFLYLVQTPERLPEHYSDIVSEDADLVLLTFKKEVNGAIYFPKSTWTTGRNRLVEEAIKRADEYEYFIFLDDDITFQKGGWRLFEERLVKYRPAFAYPFCPWYAAGLSPGATEATREAQQCLYFDAIYNAIHRDVLKDGLLLPYHPEFDSKSWWYSQFFIILLAWHFYRGHVLQFNEIVVDNSAHSPYPQGEQFREIGLWFERTVMRGIKPAFLPHAWRFRIERRLRAMAGRVAAPRPARASYRIPERRIRRLMRTTDANPFWRNYVARHGRRR